jgi:hypothetical protein
MGGQAEATVPAAVADGRAVKAFFDQLGQLGVIPRGIAGVPLFPDAAIPADNATEPSMSRVMAYIMGYDGATWDRIRGTSANGLAVDITRIRQSAISPAAPTFATVGTSSAQAVAQNNNRKGLILTNTSANIIYLGFDSAAVVGRGVVLFPNGVYCMGTYDFTTLAVLAIATGASSNMAVQEYS